MRNKQATKLLALLTIAITPSCLWGLWDEDTVLANASDPISFDVYLPNNPNKHVILQCVRSKYLTDPNADDPAQLHKDHMNDKDNRFLGLRSQTSTGWEPAQAWTGSKPALTDPAGVDYYKASFHNVSLGKNKSISDDCWHDSAQATGGNSNIAPMMARLVAFTYRNGDPNNRDYLATFNLEPQATCIVHGAIATGNIASAVIDCAQTHGPYQSSVRVYANRAD